ncbi:MAG: class I SAM-dependent methyltransferase [Acidimicrobiales bacterium]
MDAAEWDARYRAQELVWSAEPNRFLVEETASLAPGTALDVASGEGRNAIWLAEQGWTVVGFDFSSVACEKATNLARDRGVAFVPHVADVTTCRMGENEFDLALVFYLQLAAADLRKAISGAARSLVEGGTILVVAHDISNLDGGWGGPQDRTVLYHAQDVVSDLPAGCRVIKAQRVERLVDTQDGPRTAYDLLVRARMEPTSTG